MNEQSSIIGKNSANITVEGKTNFIGSVIGGGNTTLRTGELEYSDIHDKDDITLVLMEVLHLVKTIKMNGIYQNLLEQTME